MLTFREYVPHPSSPIMACVQACDPLAEHDSANVAADDGRSLSEKVRAWASGNPDQRLVVSVVIRPEARSSASRLAMKSGLVLRDDGVLRGSVTADEALDLGERACVQSVQIEGPDNPRAA